MGVSAKEPCSLSAPSSSSSSSASSPRSAGPFSGSPAKGSSSPSKRVGPRRIVNVVMTTESAMTEASSDLTAGAGQHLRKLRKRRWDRREKAPVVVVKKSKQRGRTTTGAADRRTPRGSRASSGGAAQDEDIEDDVGNAEKDLENLAKCVTKDLSNHKKNIRSSCSKNSNDDSSSCSSNSQENPSRINNNNTTTTTNDKQPTTVVLDPTVGGKACGSTMRPPVKLTVKLKEGRKPCQVHVVNSSIQPNATAAAPYEGPSEDLLAAKVVVVRAAPVDMDDAVKTEETAPDEPEKLNQLLPEEKASSESSEEAMESLNLWKRLNFALDGVGLVKAVEELGFDKDGNIPTTILTRDAPPPTIPTAPLTREELLPPTPCVFVRSREEAFSPQLYEMCLKRPIFVVRNVAQVCNIDLSLYSTKTLVDTHPNHPLEVRTQVEQSSDDNWDLNLERQVWYCTSSRSHTTITKYAEYQSSTLGEALGSASEEDLLRQNISSVVNPRVKPDPRKNRKMIKFGTNCDLSDESKWGPQLKELMKLPAWLRLVSAGNMLSHVGHQILGMNTVQLYMKVPCARTPGHQENNNFCAVNINIGPGDSEWFGVPNDYWGGLQRICRKNKVDFLHGSWWPNVAELNEAGIPVYRFMQRPGDVVWVNTGCVHWVQAAGWCNNIAWNVGPLTAHQYQMAIERYEWNKTQRYQSIVAMVYLSWNLARNITLTDRKLYDMIREVLMMSLRSSIQTQNFVKSKDVPVKFHGHRKHESAHYCGLCDEEVFNVLLIKENEKRHVVHCLRCSLLPSVGGKDLKGMIALIEYHQDDLLETYDNFQLEQQQSELSCGKGY